MSQDIFPMSEDVKETTFRHANGKNELELYKDEENKISKVLRVKRETVKNVEYWKIMEDKTVILSFSAEDVSAGVVDFLRTVDGFKFVLAEYKASKSKEALLNAINDRMEE